MSSHSKEFNCSLDSTVRFEKHKLERHNQALLALIPSKYLTSSTEDVVDSVSVMAQTLVLNQVFLAPSVFSYYTPATRPSLRSNRAKLHRNSHISQQSRLNCIPSHNTNDVGLLYSLTMSFITLCFVDQKGMK